MIKVLSIEELSNYNFNKYKKARYELHINYICKYFFVTTSKSEEDAISSLTEIYKGMPYRNHIVACIYKIQDNRRILLKKERIDPK